jgi:hypothetical protein
MVFRITALKVSSRIRKDLYGLVHKMGWHDMTVMNSEYLKIKRIIKIHSPIIVSGLFWKTNPDISG